MVTYFKTLNLGTIAANGNAKDSWTPERDIVIRKVMVNEKNGGQLNAVRITITIAGQTLTKPYVPASVVGNNPEYCWKPNMNVSKGSEIEVAAENTGSASVDLEVVFEYE